MAGVTEQTQASDNLFAGAKETLSLLLDSTVGTALRGQVLEFSTSLKAWIKYAGSGTAKIYAILTEDVVLTADGFAVCAVAGSKVNYNKLLGVSAMTEAEVVALLVGSGILARAATVVEV